MGQISWAGNCLPCAIELETENIVGLAEHSGYAQRRWLRGMGRYVERAMEAAIPPPLA